jgi:cell division protein FtsB
MSRAVRVLLAAVAVGGIVFLFVLPGRTWLAQGHATDVARRQDAALSQENAALGKRVAELQNTAYIEQIARQQYGLIMPGEQAYGILLPTAAPTTTTSPPPKPSHHHHSFWQSLGL